LPCDRPRAGQLLLLKVPNIIKFDPLPYDPEQTDIEPEVIDEGGKKKTVRSNDVNVIRWRYRCVTAVRASLSIRLAQKCARLCLLT
jgi:hypothetical protein